MRSIEEIRNKIADPGIRAVSFDVFDTLLLRPVPDDHHKYLLLNKRYARTGFSGLPFSFIRENAEASLRRQVLSGALPGEDFTIDRIYGEICRVFYVDRGTAQAMMEEELSLERRLVRPRNSGLALYESARKLNKKIFIATDTYLRKDHIRTLLAVCGITDYDLLLVSCEEEKRKLTGSLYQVMLSESGLLPSQILHIGDNLESDDLRAREAGLCTARIPGTMEVFSGYGCGKQVTRICRDLTDWEAASKEAGIAVSRKMAADFYFDDPFRPFDVSSAYNGDAFFAGYAALGLQLLALLRWLKKRVKEDGVRRLLFLSRDGYLPMRAYELLKSYQPDLPEAGYLYASRIALLPLMIRHPRDLYDLPLDCTRYNGAKLLGTLSFCSFPDAEDRMKRAGAADDSSSFTRASFSEFIGCFIEHAYDEERHRKSRRKAEEYLKHNPLSPVEEGCAVFDLGYSGRPALAIRDGSGADPVFYYFQGNGADLLNRAALGGLTVRTFLDFSPYMEPTLREYAYLEAAPSCIGYTEDLKPVFDEGPSEGYPDSARLLQEGALAFVKDFLELFHGYEGQTAFRFHNAALPFEAFLRFCSGKDLEIYRDVMIDDELWGGRRDIGLNALREARNRKLPDYAKAGDPK